MANRIASANNVARRRALKAERVNFDLEPEFKFLPGWPAICALGRNYPELAYKQFRNHKHGFVYDNRRLSENQAPIARIDQVRDQDYHVIVDNHDLYNARTVGQCLQFIRVNILKVI